MIKLKEGQKVLSEDGFIYEIEKGDILFTLDEKISKDFEKDVLKRPLEFRYQMLNRLMTDADVYLYTGTGHRKKKGYGH